MTPNMMRRLADSMEMDWEDTAQLLDLDLDEAETQEEIDKIMKMRERYQEDYAKFKKALLHMDLEEADRLTMKLFVE